MTATLSCAHCGGDLGFGDRYCALCGAESLACASCGRSLLPGDLSCPHCGTPADPITPNDLSLAPDDSPSPWTDMVERLRRATLGEFEIGGELGRGGMAAVFLAHDIALDRAVAIKVMSPGLLLGEGMTDRFKHEAITVARLNHPHIVSVYSVRQAEGLHFFVMRYVRGRALDQVIRAAGRLPLPVVRSILSQVGSALTYAHRAGVIHRDIKPANILIAEDGDAIVTDFGIAKAAERPSHTLTGALVGTPAYMSPEQCHGGEVGWASDQYSLGAVAYELVTGAPPFSGSTFTVMQAHLERAPQPVRALWPDCPPEVEAAILRMLDKDPAARWPRMADAMAALGAAPLAEDDPFRAELSRWADAGGASLSEPPTPTSPIPRTRTSLAASGPGRAVGGIAIMPAPPGLEVGDSFMLVAVIRGQHGTRLPPRAVSWSTDTPGVLLVDGAGGMATAVAPGSALLTATCKGIKALLRVEVATPRADEIVIGSADEPLHVGDEIRLEATPRDKRGWPLSRPVVWQSADPAIAEVTPHGAIAGRTPGTVRISCALDDARASLVIPVLPPRVAVLDIGQVPPSIRVGETFALAATPLDRMNVPLPHRPILWSTSDVTVAVVTAEGWLAAMRPGAVVLTATCEGLSASVRVTVVARPVLAAVAPVPASAPPARRRSRRSRRRRLLAAAGTAVLGVGLWLSSRPAPPGESAATGLSASMELAEPTAALDSVGPAAVVITRRPTRALRPDSVVRLAAEVRNAAGQAIPSAGVVWSSRDSTVARVDPATGRVRGLRPGRVAILAANGERSDSVLILVRRAGSVAAAASVAIAPHGPLRVGEFAALTAFVLGATGDTLPGAELGWSSSDTSVATVDPFTGTVHGLAPGTALILARSGVATTMSELSVLPGSVAALQILGLRPMAVRETLALRVLARDAWGAEVTGEPVAWTSADSDVATVDPRSGAVVARVPGTTKITATAGGMTERGHLTVLPRPEPIHSGSEGADEARRDPAVEAGVGECYAALRGNDLNRLTAMYHPSTKSDREMLKRLSRILGTSPSSVTVGERLDRDPQIGADDATMDFSVRLTWRGSSGEPRSSEPLFRAEFARSARGWELSSCRIVGTPGF
jgi:serine/threonine protein kinase